MAEVIHHHEHDESSVAVLLISIIAIIAVAAFAFYLFARFGTGTRATPSGTTVEVNGDVQVPAETTPPSNNY
jgi:flagellar biogenesis protein FliO